MLNYETLDTGCIQLLTVLRGGNDDKLQCELSVVRLDDFPPFEALSYVWGPPNFTSKLCCGSHGSLMVTPSLREGLRKFRSRSFDRTIWVDQICVNQKDLKKRTAQVLLIGQIYERA
jgi:hypothetical protein